VKVLKLRVGAKATACTIDRIDFGTKEFRRFIRPVGIEDGNCGSGADGPKGTLT
jgi:hypothetical protein